MLKRKAKKNSRIGGQMPEVSERNRRSQEELSLIIK
jgi:hypothetical protein